jgi:hypothetical protein
VFTRLSHWSLSWARLIQSIIPYPISLKYIVILLSYSRLGLPSGLFPSGFLKEACMHSYSPHVCWMPCPAHPPWLDHSNYIWRRVQVMKLLAVQIFPTSISSLFGPNIFLSTLLSNTLCVYPEDMRPGCWGGRYQSILMWVPINILVQHSVIFKDAILSIPN